MTEKNDNKSDYTLNKDNVPIHSDLLDAQRDITKAHRGAKRRQNFEKGAQIYMKAAGTLFFGGLGTYLLYNAITRTDLEMDFRLKLGGFGIACFGLVGGIFQISKEAKKTPIRELIDTNERLLKKAKDNTDDVAKKPFSDISDLSQLSKEVLKRPDLVKRQNNKGTKPE